MARAPRRPAPTRPTIPDPTAAATAKATLRSVLAARAPDALLDVAEAAVYCGLAEQTIRNNATRRRLPVDGRARGPLFKKSTLDAFLAARAGR